MLQDARLTYPPLNTSKPVAEGIWIIDGPVIRFGVPGFRMPLPARALHSSTSGMEVVFFHVASGTLLVTDLIENFEPSKTGTFWMRLLTGAGGVRDPDGSTPRDMRLSFKRNRAQVKAAVETMLAWNPERVVLAHGCWYACKGAAELRRAFRWVLER